MIDDEVDEFLAHYGIKGMKWGVRRAQAAKVAGVIGRGGKRAGLATGRGIKKAAVYSKANPKTAAKIALGATFVAGYLALKVASLNKSKSTKVGSRAAVRILKSTTVDPMKDTFRLAGSGSKDVFKMTRVIPKETLRTVRSL